MRNAIKQLVRYGIVGALANAVGYILYLVITTAGMEHKLAMTIVYTMGVVQTFVFNKHWSFRHRGKQGAIFSRYCLTYALGYLLNFVALYFFGDQLRWSHEFVQAVMVFIVATLVFVLQKYWVFRMSPVKICLENIQEGS